MNVEVAPFQVDDLNYLDVQPRHRELVEKALEPEMRIYAERCLVGPWSFTAWAPEGHVLWTIGVYDSEIWGFLAKDLKKHMVCLVRWGRGKLVEYWAATRQPLLVDCHFDEAVRLAKALGCRHIGGIHWIFDEQCASSMHRSQS